MGRRLWTVYPVVFSAAALMLGGGASAQAIAEEPVVNQISVGAGHTAHDLLGSPNNEPEQGVTISADLLFQPLDLLSAVGSPQPYVGVTAILDRTNFLSAGLSWRVHMSNFYVDIGGGGAVHDGYVTLETPDPSASGEENERRRSLLLDRSAFQSRVIFHGRVTVGMNVEEDWGVEAGYQHWSNGKLGSPKNDGVDLFDVRLVRRF